MMCVQQKNKQVYSNMNNNNEKTNANREEISICMICKTKTKCLRVYTYVESCLVWLWVKITWIAERNAKWKDHSETGIALDEITQLNRFFFFLF